MSNLTFEIVKHIMNGFGLTHDSKAFSLKQDKFLLKNKISLQIDDDTLITKKVWGGEISIQQEHLKVLVSDFSEENEEIYMIVCLENTPVYCIYFNSGQPSFNSIYLSLENSGWLRCNIELQANFLSGIEKIKDLPTSFKPITLNEKEFNLLSQFINYNEEYNL